VGEAFAAFLGFEGGGFEGEEVEVVGCGGEVEVCGEGVGCAWGLDARGVGLGGLGWGGGLLLADDGRMLWTKEELSTRLANKSCPWVKGQITSGSKGWMTGGDLCMSVSDLRWKRKMGVFSLEEWSKATSS